MLSFMVSTVLPLLGTFAVGIAGWVLTNFAAKEILRFYSLRDRVHEALVYTANVLSPETDNDRYDSAVAELRRLAAQLTAFKHASSGLTKWFLRRRGYDLETASSRLIGVSNSVSRHDRSLPLQRHGVERGLKLPMTHTDEEIRQIDETHRRRT